MRVTIQRQGRLEKGHSAIPTGAAVFIGLVIGAVAVILVVLLRLVTAE